MPDNFLLWVGAIGGILGTVLSLISLKFTWDQKRLQERVAFLHLEPKLALSFAQQGGANPFLKIQNIGDVSIVSLSVTEDVYVFDKRLKSISAAAKTGNSFSERVYYKEELKPSESDTHHSVRWDAHYPATAIYRYGIKFYRGNDMNLFQREEIYFVDDGTKVFTHDKFRESSMYYALVMKCIETFHFPEMERTVVE